MKAFFASLTSTEIYQGCRTPSDRSELPESSSEPSLSPSSSAREIYEGLRTPDLSELSFRSDDNERAVDVASDTSASSERRRSSRGIFTDSYNSTKTEQGGFRFTVSEIYRATKNFSPTYKIGQGGFGTVYKGRLDDGTYVAVKRAKKALYDKHLGVEFRSEVQTLAHIEHLNLVKFFGSLEHEDERIIVVEYVPNGTLREHLDDASKSTSRTGLSSNGSSLTVPSYSSRSTNDLPTPRTEGQILSSPNLRDFSFNELKNATKNFGPDSFVGEGGFGYVFKGWIDEQTYAASRPGAGTVVAVKKHKPESFQGHKEWLTDVNYLGQLHHPNLVRLIGYCLEGEIHLSVYEYMAKGSLENHLFKRAARPLSWATRIKVAIDAARGLSFLHDAESQVIHRNFKASNILLDADFKAKLSDFQLAKAGPTGDKTHVSTQVMGTLGYAAPEYIATGRLSAKSDVYSFGVVLLELLTGRRALDKSKLGIEQNLVDWAKPFLSDKRKLFRVMDSKLEGQYPQKAAHQVAILAVQCLFPEAKVRPRMAEVLATLEQLQSAKSFSKASQCDVELAMFQH